MFFLKKKTLIRGVKQHLRAGLGEAADYVASYEPLYAPFDGQLNIPYKDGGQGGNWLAVRRLNGDNIEFAHLSKRVKMSGRVKEGEQIAITGNTGTKTTGPHCHTQIIRDGKRLDPEQYLWENMNKIKVFITGNEPAVNWQDIVNFFNNGIEFIRSGDSHMLLEFIPSYIDGRGGNAFGWKQYKENGFWKIQIQVSDKGQYSYEDIIIHEILHEFCYVAGLGDIHDYGWGVLNNKEVFDFLKTKIETKAEPPYRYVIDNHGHQYILIQDLKVAISIADEQELADLKDRGLSPSPESVMELPDGYVKYPGVRSSRLSNILNI